MTRILALAYPQQRDCRPNRRGQGVRMRSAGECLAGSNVAQERTYSVPETTSSGVLLGTTTAERLDMPAQYIRTRAALAFYADYFRGGSP
jgi:hypothetical protein